MSFALRVTEERFNAAPTHSVTYSSPAYSETGELYGLVVDVDFDTVQTFEQIELVDLRIIDGRLFSTPYPARVEDVRAIRVHVGLDGSFLSVFPKPVPTTEIVTPARIGSDGFIVKPVLTEGPGTKVVPIGEPPHIPELPELPDMED